LPNPEHNIIINKNPLAGFEAPMTGWF